MVNFQTKGTVLLILLLQTMPPSQRRVLSLLLGLTVTSVAASCFLSQDGRRCVCSVNSIISQEVLFCLFNMELEVRDGKLPDFQLNLSSGLPVSLVTIRKLIFRNVTVSVSLISAVTIFPNLNEINIISSSLEAAQSCAQSLEAFKIESLLLEDITVDPSLLQPSCQTLHQHFFGSLKSLRLLRSGLAEIGCSWAQRMQNLTHLDFSENPISYTVLQNLSHCSSLLFKSLKSLDLRKSNLTSLQSLCTPLSLTPALTQLDVSANNFSIIHYPHCLQVKKLNLSHSGITEVNSLLYASLEELDLSSNYLEVFNNPPPTLRRLYLSNNHLMSLLSLDALIYLKELKVDSNRLPVLIDGTQINVSTLERLDTLHAARNPYHCNCTLRETVVFLNSTRSVIVENYPEDFLCASPVTQQGSKIRNLAFEGCVKPNNWTQNRGSTMCLTLFAGLMSPMIYFG